MHKHTHKPASCLLVRFSFSVVILCVVSVLDLAFLRIILCYSLFVYVCFCCVIFSFFSTVPRDWLRRTSPKWLILCWVGRKTLSQSISHQGEMKNRKQVKTSVGNSLLADRIVLSRLDTIRWPNMCPNLPSFVSSGMLNLVQPVHVQGESKHYIPWGSREIFPQWLRIFEQIFTHLSYVHSAVNYNFYLISTTVMRPDNSNTGEL